VDKTPFSVYDFFAYLASGAMIVVTVDYLFGEQLVLRPALSPQVYLLLVIASYIVGQVISHLSAVVLEQWLVKRLLGGSTGLMLAGEHSRSPWARLFPQYFHGLKAATAARVMAQAERRGCKLTGDELYDHCYAVVTEASERARVVEHENILNRLVAPGAPQTRFGVAASNNDTYFRSPKAFLFNG